MRSVDVGMAVGAFFGVIAGNLLYAAARLLIRKIPRYIVAVEYKATLPGCDPQSYVFYLRGDKSVRGGEDGAHQFWTEKGARVAAAQFKLADCLEDIASFHFVQLRIVRINAL